MLAKTQRCEELSSPSIANFVVSCVILVGLLLSYIPQHIRIIQRRTSEGLSPYYVLLGATSGTCAIANILILPTSREDMACCTVNSGFSCTAGLLGIAQIGVQWSCFFLITLLFLVFIPRSTTTERQRGITAPAVGALLEPTESRLREAVIVVAACIIHFIITFILCIVTIARFPRHLQALANVLGIVSAILATLQYLPQIWMTWQLQHIGSLSIPMMLIQTPGAFIFAASLAARLGKAGWSTWAVYIVTGLLQGCLLVMAISFDRRDRLERSKQPSDARQSLDGHVSPEDPLDQDSESTSLLREVSP